MLRIMLAFACVLPLTAPFARPLAAADAAVGTAEDGAADASLAHSTFRLEMEGIRGGKAYRELLVFREGTITTSYIQDLEGPSAARCTVVPATHGVSFAATYTGIEHVLPDIATLLGDGAGDTTVRSSSGRMPGSPRTVVYQGTVIGDTISGTFAWLVDGARIDETHFTGRRIGAAQEIPRYASWHTRIHDVGGKAVLVCDGFRLTFTDVHLREGNEIGGTIGISGMGETSGGVGVPEDPDHYTEAYADDVGTITFHDHRILISGCGTHLEIDGESFDLGSSWPIITVASGVKPRLVSTMTATCISANP